MSDRRSIGVEACSSTRSHGARVLCAALATATVACTPTGARLDPQGPLHRAAYRGDLGETRRRIEAGDSLETKDGFEWTPLHFAAIAGRPEIAALLLDRGADPNARARYDMTPLHWASLKGHREVVALLVRRGARVDARNMYGQTALHEAATTEVAEVLLAAGASLSAVDFEGMTPLHIARSGALAKMLLGRGADIRTRSRDGRTGLDVAVMEMLGPKGLMFYGNRTATRLRGERARVTVTIRNISEHVIPDLTLDVDSEACTGSSTPARIGRLHPAEQTAMTFDLHRRPGAGEDVYRLDFVVRTASASLGAVDLKVDTTTATTPEDLGMTRLGRGSLRKKATPWSQLVYGVIPLLIAALWYLAHRRRGPGGVDPDGSTRRPGG